MIIVENSEQLQDLCRVLTQQSYLCLDSEFLRDKTYYPKLCLLQIAYEGGEFMVDPLVEAIDLSPLFTLLHNPGITKVFHSGRQDIEILYNLTGKVPYPIFDTQIAAMICGLGESLSYAALVEQSTGHTLNKAVQFTDWAQRPLSLEQLEYALADVTYLRPVYEHMKQKIHTLNRQGWLQEELEKLYDPHNYCIPPEEAWRKLPLQSTSPSYRLCLREVAKWREITARNKDRPRARILRDNQIVAIAKTLPTTMDALHRIPDIKRLNMVLRRQVLATVQHAMSLPASAAPALSAYDKTTPAVADKALINMLKALLSITCSRHNISERIIASKEELVLLAAQNETDSATTIPALQNWRYDIFGKHALALKQGKLMLQMTGEHATYHYVK